jgi:hypothetical protein
MQVVLDGCTPSQLPRRLRVAAAFFADAERAAAGPEAAAFPPSRPPVRRGMPVVCFPLPEPPGFLPPPSSLFTVAQARRLASFDAPLFASPPRYGRLCVPACRCTLTCRRGAFDISIAAGAGCVMLLLAVQLQYSALVPA